MATPMRPFRAEPTSNLFASFVQPFASFVFRLSTQRTRRPHEGHKSGKSLRLLVALALVCPAAHPAEAGALSGDAARGEQIYQACTDCHSLDQNDVGPRHRGVYGRKAGSLHDYSYSEALKSSNITWNAETLDKWLTDPQAFVPGAKMFFHLDGAQDRADVIAYLKEKAR